MFELNQIVFTPDGRRARFIASTPEGIVVRLGFYEPRGYDEEDEYFETVQIFDKVFEAAPCESYDKKVIRLRAEIEKLEAQAGSLREEIRTSTTERTNLLSKLKQHAALKHIDDWLEGRFTHVVKVPYSWSVEVLTAESALASKDERNYPPVKRLVTLFGAANGDLQWRISRWSDGSGGDDCEAHFFGSEAEARAFALELIAQKFSSTGLNHYGQGELVKSARILGAPIPPAVIDRLNADKAEEARKRLQKAAAEQAKAAAELAEINGTAA